MLTPSPSTTIIGVNVGPSTPGGSGSDPIGKAWVFFAFNPVTKFFEKSHTNHQGVKIEKLCTL
jgi:hypothetical protein